MPRPSITGRDIIEKGVALTTRTLPGSSVYMPIMCQRDDVRDQETF